MSLYQNKIDGFLCVEKKDGLVDFGMKLHSNIEMVFIFEGETNVWIDNREAERAESGDAIIIFPCQQYRYETVRQEDHILLAVDIKRIGEFLRAVTANIPTRNVIKGAMQSAELCELVKNIAKTYREDESEYRDTVLKGYVTALLGKLLSMTELKKNEIEKPNTVSEIMDFCNRHYSEKLSLEYLEEELHISKYYISHVINERLGVSFNDFVNSIRINEASRLLVESDKPIKEISAEVGFGTQRTSDRAFKKQKGETAREYRQRNL